MLRTVITMAPAMALFSLLAGCDRIEAYFAPKAELWVRWQAHDPSSTLPIDHSAWGEFLGAHLGTGDDGVNRIAYGMVSASTRSGLRAYLDGLASLPISSYGRAEQLAYWVNFYNALTVELVLSRYPVKSMMDIRISPGLLAYGPWGKNLTEVEGEALSLNDIEHRILRPIWRDPRIHYVLNCASVGCPNLPREPLTAQNGERLLDAAAREYINHPRGVREEKGKVVVSKIYNWFSADFGADTAGILAHIAQFARSPLAEALRRAGRIDRYEYDWALNDARTP